MNLKIQLALLSLIRLQAAVLYTDDSDKYTLSLHLREKDIFKLDVNQVISFKSNSANFYCDNPGINLPGVLASNNILSVPLPESIIPDMAVSNTDALVVIANRKQDMYCLRNSPSQQILINKVPIPRKLTNEENLNDDPKMVI